uniref:Teleost multiple tissue opsin b n=1 Tax=Mastacembelus armatus TaxID=205130 RepID=A0A7N9ATA6_9TELE
GYKGWMDGWMDGWIKYSTGEWTSSSTPQSLSPMGNIVVAVSLACIGIFGFLSNFVVLSLFYRFRALRTPMNLLLVSISASDLMVSVLGTPFSFAASTQGQWLIGHAGCVWYGFINACLGIVSLISLAVLSYERYCTMISPTIADNKNYRSAVLGIGFSWLYSLAWTVPPLLGWTVRVESKIINPWSAIFKITLKIKVKNFNHRLI